MNSKLMITKSVIILFLIGISSNVFAQNNSIEQLRASAYKAKLKGDYQESITNYKKILEKQSDDYDAKLALARLYFKTENYKKSTAFFNSIYKNDSTDVEALMGLGENYLYTDKVDESIVYIQKAISLLPDYVPLYLQLAKAYSWQGDLDKAIEIYNKSFTIDDTYSEAWRGLGKMYYWKDKPKTALYFYEKAVALDPSDQSIKKEFEQLKNELKYSFSATYKKLNETEESYQINALIQQYGLSKRFNDHFNISVNHLLDYSNRDFTNTEIGDTIRWFDNTWLKTGLITEHHRISLYGGYSKSDDIFTSYGLNWRYKFSLKSVDFTNSLTAGYDYFYYWNKIGHKALTDNFSAQYKRFKLNLSYGYGLIDTAAVNDIPNDNYFEGTNPHEEYGVSLSYKVLSKPKITLSANYSYLNFKYKSRLYYSPFDRKLFGPSASIYYPFKNFYFYGGFAFNFGSEFYYDVIDSSVKKIYLNADNWSANAEIGYNYKSFAVSFSASRFYNDYYSNYLIALNLKYNF